MPCRVRNILNDAVLWEHAKIVARGDEGEYTVSYRYSKSLRTNRLTRCEQIIEGNAVIDLTRRHLKTPDLLAHSHLRQRTIYMDNSDSRGIPYLAASWILMTGCSIVPCGLDRSASGGVDSG